MKNSPKNIKIVRRYNPDYIKFVFVNGGDDAEPKDQCVESGLTLSNEALYPSKLKQHLESRHFKRKENGLQKQKRNYKYRKGLSFLWLHNLKVHWKLLGREMCGTDQESLRHSGGIGAASRCGMHQCGMIGEAATTIPLSNDTVSRRISEMASDIQTQVV